MTKHTSRTIAQIAGEAVSKKGYATTIDVLLGLGWLSQADLQRWRSGEVRYLEQVVHANLSKISQAAQTFRQWATHSNLHPSYTAYVKQGKGPKLKLQFSKSGATNIEQSYATHFVLKQWKGSEKSDPLNNRIETGRDVIGTPQETSLWQHTPHSDAQLRSP